MVSKWRDVVVPHPIYLRPACPSGTVPCNDDDDDDDGSDLDINVYGTI